MYLLCYTVHWIFTIVYLKLNKTMNWGGYLWLSKVKRLMKSLTLETLLTSINFDWALEPCSVRPVWFLCYLWLYNDGRVMFCRLFSFNFMGGCLLWFVFCCFYFDSMFRVCVVAWVTWLLFLWRHPSHLLRRGVIGLTCFCFANQAAYFKPAETLLDARVYREPPWYQLGSRLVTLWTFSCAFWWVFVTVSLLRLFQCLPCPHSPALSGRLLCFLMDSCNLDFFVDLPTLC